MEVLRAEQMLLGCILKSGELIKEITVEPEAFADQRHRRLYTWMQEIDSRGEKVDVVSLTIHAGFEIDAAGGDTYISELANSVPSAHDYKTYSTYINKAFKMRKAMERVREANQGIRNIKDMDKLQCILSEATEILESGQEKKFSLKDTLSRIHEEVEKEKTDDINGMPTGFKGLDRLLDGWQLQDLNIIAARPSMGKTAFALALAKHAAQKGEYVDIFSLEMSAELLLKRMICMIGGINSMKLKNARKYFSDQDWERYTNAMAVLNNFKRNLYISDESSPTVQDIRARVRQSIRDYPNQRHLVIIDYLTLIKGSGRGERHLEVGEISRSLKRMARELNVSVILLSQLSRRVEQRQEKRPQLSDIRDSGEVEQDADTISFLYRDDYYDTESEKKNVVEVIVAKQRNGPLGKIELAFLKDTNTFVDLQKR